MFRRKLNKALAIVVAAATVATTVCPVGVLAAEVDDPFAVEDVVEDGEAEEEEAVEDETEETSEEVEEAEETEEESEDEEEATEEETEEVSDESSEAAPTDFTENGDYEIAIGDFTVFDVNGGTLTDGVFRNSKQFGQVYLSLPEGVDPLRVKKIKVNVDTEDYFSVKACAGAGDLGDGTAVYGTSTLPVPEGTDFSTIGIMSTAADEMTYTITSIVITIGDLPVPDDNAPVKDEYTFKDLTYADKQNADYAIDDDGVLTVTFNNQYAQVFFKLPEALEKRVVSKVTWNLADGSKSDGLSVKILSEADFNTEQRNGDVNVAYGSNSVAAKSDELGATARYIAVMTTKESGDGQQGGPLAEPLEMSFTGVSIETKALDRPIENNILADFNGSFENDYYWNDGNWGKTNFEFAEYSSENKAPSSKVGSRFGKVTDPEAALTAETEDPDKVLPTTLMNAATDIQCGYTYEFSFWAKLDEAAEGVENPTVDLKVQMHASNWSGASIYSDIKYDDGNELTSAWKKYTGEFTLEAGDGSQTESKISVQSQDGVSFSVDDIQIGEKWIDHIQEDIPNFYEEMAKQGIPMSGVAISSNTLEDEVGMQLVFKHFNSISCENAMKPEVILGSAPKTPVDSVNDLDLHFEEPEKTCDAVVAYNEANGTNVKMRGHVMVWHSQTPAWFFREGFQANGARVTPEVMNQRIDDYIKRVAEHFDQKYPGLIYAWDVVNEQADDNGGIRMGTEWAAVYGGSDEYIIQAFKSADKYLAPSTILFYNDYNECTPAKRDQIVKFLTKIKENISADRKLGAGMQGHHDMLTPSASLIEAAASAYAEVADYVHVTELDIKSSVGFDGKDLATEFTKNGYRYREVYDALMKVNAKYDNNKVQCVTIWGTHDKVSWLKTSNSVGGSADGKTPQYPLIFDDRYQAKPAFWALVDPDGTISPENALKPYVNSVTVLQAVNEDDPFATGISYDIKTKDDTKASFVPVWVDGKLLIKATVEGVAVPAAESADGVVVYLEAGTPIAATKVDTIDNGYVATFEIPAEIKAGANFRLDVVVKNGEKTYAFNDTTLNQANSNEYFAKGTYKLYMAIARGTVTIDGDIDAAWDYAEDVTLAVKANKPNASVVGRVLWDEDNLYVLMKVKDAVLDAASSQVHEKDSVEIFVDENNAKADSYQDDDKQIRINYLNEASFNGPKAGEDILKHAVKLTDDGYVVEAAIAWTDVTPEIGNEIGIDLQINDAEGGTRIGTVNWYDETGNGWSSPAVFGSAILTGKDTEEINIQSVADCVFTGKPVKPAVVIRRGGMKLVEGKDYTVRYTNNVKVAAKKGTGMKDDFDKTLPTVTITGKGDFKGTLTANFSIVKADITTDAFTYTYATEAKESTKATKPAVTVKYNKATVAKTNYTVTYRAEGETEAVEAIPANASGNWTIIVTAKGDSYEGEVELPLFILNKDQKSVSKLAITVVKGKDYTGEAIELTTEKVGKVNAELVVKDGTKVLVKDTDYEVAYDNNVEVGKASVTITGLGNYLGSVTKTFDIKGVDVRRLRITLPAKVDYTGSAITFDAEELVVKDGVTTLTEDTHYSVAYANNTNAGKATVSITGIGKYYGTINKTFTITGIPFTSTTIAKLDAVTYDGKVKNPKLNVTLKCTTDAMAAAFDAKKGDVVDVPASYYDVKLVKGGTDAGTATYSVTGKKIFTGSKNVTLTINKLDVTAEGSGVVVADIAAVDYSKAGNKPAVTVKYGSTVLTSGKDYTVVYSKNTKATTEALATVNFRGNFKGVVKKTFTINAVELNDTDFTATAKDIVATKAGAFKTTVAITDSNGKKLAANVDYDANIAYYIGSVSDENLVNAKNLNEKKAALVPGTTMIAVVNGKNNFTGSIEIEYRLVDVLATSITVKVADKVFTGDTVVINPEDVTATVRVNGKVETLVCGTDFDLEYLDDCKKVGVHKLELVPATTTESGITIGNTKIVNVKVTPRTVEWAGEDWFTIIQNWLFN